MEFHQFKTLYEYCKSGLPKAINNPEAFYAGCLGLTRGDDNSSIAEDQFRSDYNWIKSKRPYYRVWSAIIPSLVRVNIEKIKATDLIKNKKEHHIAFNFQKENNPLSFVYKDKTNYVQSILFNIVDYLNRRGEKLAGICMWIDTGEIYNNLPLMTFRRFRCHEGKTVAQELADTNNICYEDFGTPFPNDLLEKVVKLCCAICLIDSDTELLTPDVLSQLKDKYSSADEREKQAIIDKSHRRGKIGWDVGKLIHENRESSPHYTAPYYAIRWMGKGGVEPKLRPVSGYWASRDKINKIPEGYLGEIE